MTDPNDRRAVLCDWLTANGLNPKLVPRDAEIYIETADDGTRTLHCDQRLTTPDGAPFLNERGDSAAMGQTTVPLTAEPPSWWQPYRTPTREQLLNAALAVQQLHRGVDDHGDTICAHCSDWDPTGGTGSAPVPYPCATVTALGSLPTATMAQQAAA